MSEYNNILGKTKQKQETIHILYRSLTLHCEMISLKYLPHCYQ